MYDIAYLRSNMVLMAPKNEAELQQMVVTGVNYTDGPIAMRAIRAVTATVSRWKKAGRLCPSAKVKCARRRRPHSGIRLDGLPSHAGC